jgi:hypothetical protein
MWISRCELPKCSLVEGQAVGAELEVLPVLFTAHVLAKGY